MRRRPIQDSEYTGLTDTAVGYTGSTTLDSGVDPGSSLLLVAGPNRNDSANLTSRNNPALFTKGTADLWDNDDPNAALAFSGVSDPPFASLRQSSPRPYAAPATTAASNAFMGQSKWGSAMATLLGSHPTTVASAPSTLPAAQGVITTDPPALSGTMTIVVLALVIGLIALLAPVEND
jgi:hypothetical protein